MKLNIRLLSLTILLGLVAFGCTGPDKADQSKLGKLTVDSLKVEDIPADGGDGLLLSWKPLPKERRVQEYRVYRGVHPDTLFFLASVQVNVKTGVATDQMFYYDSGYSPLISLDSPSKLKNERGAKGSNLYSGVPRDGALAARLSECFSLYTQMDASDYYHRTVKAFSADKEDKTVYAGMKFNRQTILASLQSPQPGAEPVNYYYTVVPVNERNQYLGIAKPVSGYPLDDAPGASPELHCVALADTEELRFEWEYPLNNGDIGSYAIYPQASESSPPGNPLIQGPIGGGGLKNNCVVDKAYLASAGLTSSWQQLINSGYVIQFVDFAGNPSPFSPLSSPILTNTSALPKKANFRVEDKPIDKGDRITVIWQEPVVSITKTSALNKKGTKLKVNYQVNKIDAQKINNIYFEFFEPGKNVAFAKINEFYQDNIINLNIDPKYSLKNGKLPQDSLKVKITIATQPYKLNPRNGRILYEKTKLVENYEFVQYLKPDPGMMSYMPTRELLLNGVDIAGINSVVYRKGYRGKSFGQVKSTTAYENYLDVTINYVASIGQPVQGFNFVKGDSLHTYMNGQRYSRKLAKGEKPQDLALMSSDIDLTLDLESESTLSSSIYLDEAKKKLPDLKADLADLQEELKVNTSSLATARPDSAKVLEGIMAAQTQKIENLEKQIKAYTDNPTYQKTLKAKSNRSLMRYVASVREPEQRMHNYSIIRTNGKGLFTESDPDTLATGEYAYYSPISNWFDWNKLFTLFAVIIFGVMVVLFVHLAKKGKNLYMRPIAGLEEIDNAIGRATEMGRPMLYCMGNGGLSDMATLASMGILSLVAKKAAEYDTRLIVPCYDYIVMPIAQEIVREAHYAVGRPDSFDKNDVFYLTSVQFAYVAGVNGIMIREKMATNFFLGYFAAEALLMTETGNAVGAMQIAGSDAITQIPFFITTCDYTLIGEELYAASAYLNREPMLLGTLKAQDYFKLLLLFFIITGAVLASFQLTGLMQLFPLK